MQRLIISRLNPPRGNSHASGRTQSNRWGQWFSSLSVHQTHLEDLFKHRTLGSTSGVSDLVGLSRAQECILSIDPETTLEKHCLRVSPTRVPVEPIKMTFSTALFMVAVGNDLDIHLWGN